MENARNAESVKKKINKIMIYESVLLNYEKYRVIKVFSKNKKF